MKAEIKLHRDRIYVKTPYSAALVDRFRSIPGRKFHPQDKNWSFPAAPDTVRMACDVLGLLPLFLSEELRKIAGPGPESIQRLEVDESLVDNWAFVVEPYRHQRRNLAILLQHNRWLLADEMGTGKTFAVISALMARGFNSLAQWLIVCPKSVIGTWEEQYRKYAGQDMIELRTDITQLRASPLICNYERLLRDDILPGIAWSGIIFDEVHRLKNITSQTSKICRDMSNRATFVYGLSGTPAPNGLEDWLGVLSVIDPHLLPVENKKQFHDRYCVRERIGDLPAFRTVGYRNVSELHGYITSRVSRVTKAQCLDLPEKIFAPRYVTLQGEQARIYREIKRDAVALLSSAKASGTLTVKNTITEALRLLQIVGGFVPDDEGRIHPLPEKAKLEALQDILQECGDRQVVIWCHFKEEAYFLADWLEGNLRGDEVKAPFGCVSILTGDTSQDDREDALDRFFKGKTKFFVATASAGGTGVNGLQVADTEIYYSRSWSLTDWLQSQDRLHRIGQKNKVSIIPIIAQGTIDQRVNEALERKANLLEMMLQSPEEFV